MAITAVHFVQNNSDHQTLFRNEENSGHNRRIPAGEGRPIPNAWVPWADTENQYFGHHLEIRDEVTEVTLWYIWQRHIGAEDLVRADAGSAP